MYQTDNILYVLLTFYETMYITDNIPGTVFTIDLLCTNVFYRLHIVLTLTPNVQMYHTDNILYKLLTSYVTLIMLYLLLTYHVHVPYICII